MCLMESFDINTVVNHNLLELIWPIPKHMNHQTNNYKINNKLSEIMKFKWRHKIVFSIINPYPANVENMVSS
jgi:hypothetical protein